MRTGHGAIATSAFGPWRARIATGTIISMSHPTAKAGARWLPSLPILPEHSQPRVAPGFRIARTPKGDFRVYGPRIDMTLEAAIEMGVLQLV